MVIAFWTFRSATRSSRISRLPEETENLLRDSRLLSTASPSVKRVVFISTPHRGSYHAGKMVRKVRGIARLACRGTSSSASRELLKANEAGRLKGQFGKGRSRPASPTWIPANPFLNDAGRHRRSPPDVKVHSIIAVKTQRSDHGGERRSGRV